MVDQTESWVQRVSQLHEMERINYSQYIQLKEEEHQLTLTPNVKLPEIYLKKNQKLWCEHVQYLAQVYMELHKNPPSDRRELKRKKEGDIARYLEEEKDFPYYIEKEVSLLLDMKVLIDVKDTL